MLWVVFLLTLPLPMLLFGAVVPVARYLMLAGVTAALIGAEGGGAIPVQLLALFLAHALVYAGLLWLLAHLLSRLVARLAPRALAAVTLGVAVACVAAASLGRPYVTPFAASSPRANLLHVLE
jgi:hypothetical protein